MKITMPDGTILNRSFASSACVGYVAETIEFDADDIIAMRNMAALSPDIFDACMIQLSFRYASRRVSAANKVEIGA